jgi:hypothetical protein
MPSIAAARPSITKSKRPAGPRYAPGADIASGTQPEVVYHYTDWLGVQGIISTGTIRLTHAKFLNDRVEMQHGAMLIPNVIDEISQRKSTETRNLLTALCSGWKKDFSKTNAFVTSFCGRGDMLEQWRGYTPRGGCSIGFSVPIIREAAHKQRCWMLPCLYSSNQKKAHIQAILKTHLSRAPYESEEAFADQACSDLMIEVPRFKDFAFRSEREWRIFVLDEAIDEEDKLAFTASLRGIVPYLSLSFPKSAVQRIFLSPFSTDEMQFGVEYFLEANGFKHVRVFRSRVPLRTPHT